MNKTLIFFCISCCLLVFSIIVVCTGPIITDILGSASIWRSQNCKQYSDQRKYVEDKKLITNDDEKDNFNKYMKKGQHLCERQKALYGLEYAALVSDLFFGVLCSLLSLLHYFGVGQVFQKVTGIIGLACGIIGFVLTLIYIIYSGYIFTNDGPGKEYDSTISSFASTVLHYDLDDAIYKLDKDRAFAEWKDGKYKCFYYDKDKDDEDSIFAKYSDLGKKQYNYHKDFTEPNSEYKKCDINDVTSYEDPLTVCKSNLGKYLTCDKIYYSGNDDKNEISFKYEYDKWVTSIIFGCFIIALNIGLAIFGFLLFSDSSNGATPLR